MLSGMLPKMNEARRHAVLHAMGIEQWVPRANLPGAHPQHRVFPFSAGETNALAVPQENNHSGSTNTSRLLTDVSNATNTMDATNFTRGGNKKIVSRGLAIAEVLDLDSQNPSTRAISEAERKSPAAEKPREPATPAQLNTVAAVDQKHRSGLNPVAGQSADEFDLLWAASDGVLIVDDISQASFANSTYLHWVNSLFSAMGCKPLAQHTVLQQRFRWPLESAKLFDERLHAAGESAAKEMVAAWLMRALQQTQAKKIVVMGAATAAMLANKDELVSADDADSPDHARSENVGDASAPDSHGFDSHQYLGRLAIAQNLDQVPMMFTFGSQELWKDAKLKVTLWHHLQALLAADSALAPR